MPVPRLSYDCAFCHDQTSGLAFAHFDEELCHVVSYREAHIFRRKCRYRLDKNQQLTEALAGCNELNLSKNIMLYYLVMNLLVSDKALMKRNPLRLALMPDLN